ncbi:MAG: aromatic ring-hydroxylating dioxygenase subunit alpha [Burkholderiaceae bacterium]|nr:aromatic ring-hydroxylating dioxygenase subunit alpha [Burkholderiaceae bacterium]
MDMLQDDFIQLRKELKHASHAPGNIYSSPEILAREVDEYFMKDWLLVARVEELANPGDYMSMRILGEPVLVVRASDGSLGAFYNMCLHRGVEIADGSGNARAFSCPYHGWTYDLQGNLRGAARMQGVEAFDAKTRRLRPIRLDTWRGNIFICFSADTGPLSEQMAEFEKDFGFLQMDKCRLGNKVVIELECNWKLVHENVMDFYHVPVLHAKTIGGNFSWKDEDVVLKDNGGISIRYDSPTQTPDGKTLFAPMPWLESQGSSFACTGFNPPNLTIFARVDHIRTIVVWPLSATRCQVISYHVFPEQVFEMPDVEKRLKVYSDYQQVILGEDRTMIESMQRAMATRGYVPGRMSLLEKPIHHYLNGYIRRMFPDQPAESP